jgi:hypothetical protein
MANAAFKGVKALVSAGKEIEGVVGQLGKWYTAAANFYVGANKKKKPSLFSKPKPGEMSVEEEAMQIAVAKETMRKQDLELQSMIKMRYGMDVFRQMMELRIKLQKQRLEQEEELRKAKAKFHNDLWIASGGIFAAVLIMFFFWNLITYEVKHAHLTIYPHQLPHVRNSEVFRVLSRPR